MFFIILLFKSLYFWYNMGFNYIFSFPDLEEESPTALKNEIKRTAWIISMISHRLRKYAVLP